MAPTTQRAPHSGLVDHEQLPSKIKAALQELQDDFQFDLQSVVKQMLWEFSQGLSVPSTPETRDTYLPMIPTYVHDVPNGTETGKFIALDLGGTNLRVCEVTLDGKGSYDMRQEKFKVSEELKTGPAKDLFSYIAESVGKFVQHHPKDGRLDLGFTFSFPVKQTALERGTLINWTKGFSATGAAGNDVPQMLQDALDQQQIPIRVSALVNDTVGTLLSYAYKHGNALIGAIFGTGTNGAYVENTSAMPLLTSPTAKKFPHMIVNTEWGAFDNERVVLPFTRHDSAVDRRSINPRKQAFEKMISGMYLGEITRTVIVDFVDRGLLFQGHSTPALNLLYGFDTELMSLIEAPNASAESIRKVLVERLQLPASKVSDTDALTARDISHLVGTRGARLSACAVAAVIQQTNASKAGKTIMAGFDGSVAQFYPGFEERLRGALRELCGEEIEKKVQIGLAKDGSGVGAALCALAAAKQRAALGKQ